MHGVYPGPIATALTARSPHLQSPFGTTPVERPGVAKEAAKPVRLPASDGAPHTAGEGHTVGGSPAGAAHRRAAQETERPIRDTRAP